MVLHPSKSINTGGFLLGVVRDLGLIAVSPDNSMYHSHLPGTNAEAVMLARMEEEQTQLSPRPGKLKGGRPSKKADTTEVPA